MICTMMAGAAWSCVRIVLGSYGKSIGWDKYRDCCASTYEFYQGIEEQQVAAVLYEAIFAGSWFIIFAGPRLDCNILAFILKRVVPLGIRQRFSKNGRALHLWHSDGTFNAGAYGNFVGWWAAIALTPIAASPWVMWANDYAQVRGSGDQLSWVIVVVTIALRLRVTHASWLIFLSVIFSWVGFLVVLGGKARGGETSILLEAREFFLLLPPCGAWPMLRFGVRLSDSG